MSATDIIKKAQETSNSVICLGLDLDPRRMPSEYARTVRSMFDFASRIISATSDIVCAYKPNLAFYESLGTDGFSLLKQIIARVPEHIPVILDAKRSDIGNTASHYATALFDRLGASWVTINPYMGYDAIRPFLEYKDRGTFILCLTSNTGAKDFQQLMIEDKPLYEVVAEKVAYWNKEDNCGLVVGATQPEATKRLREIAGEMPILIPGVGAQGGSLELAVANGTAGFTRPAIINVSRSVLYASNGEDFAQRARQEVIKLNSAVEAVRSGQSEVQSFEMPKPPEKLPYEGEDSDGQDQQENASPSQSPSGSGKGHDRPTSSGDEQRDPAQEISTPADRSSSTGGQDQPHSN